MQCVGLQVDSNWHRSFISTLQSMLHIWKQKAKEKTEWKKLVFTTNGTRDQQRIQSSSYTRHQHFKHPAWHAVYVFKRWTWALISVLFSHDLYIFLHGWICPVRVAHAGYIYATGWWNKGIKKKMQPFKGKQYQIRWADRETYAI